jgi:hypothetical protein
MLVALVGLCGCGVDARRRTAHDAAVGNDADAWVKPDAPPPSVDAGPPPVVACDSHGNPTIDAGPQCPLPPSRCLDAIYLVYYTGGTCVDGICQFETQLMECDYQCATYGDGNGGCVVVGT